MDCIVQPKELEGLGMREDRLETPSIFLCLPKSDVEHSDVSATSRVET
jgi:hypothetical protein